MLPDVWETSDMLPYWNIFAMAFAVAFSGALNFSLLLVAPCGSVSAALPARVCRST
jgi:hypothetical protein